MHEIVYCFNFYTSIEQLYSCPIFLVKNEFFASFQLQTEPKCADQWFENKQILFIQLPLGGVPVQIYFKTLVWS